MKYFQPSQNRIITLTWVGIVSFCIHPLSAAADSPLHPSNSTVNKKPLTKELGSLELSEQNAAVHINCRKFPEPLISAKKPIQCPTGSDCQKRLEIHLCHASKPKTCDQQKLWRPVTTLIDLPKGVEIIKVTRKLQLEKQSSSVLLCVHFLNSSKPNL